MNFILFSWFCCVAMKHIPNIDSMKESFTNEFNSFYTGSTLFDLYTCQWNSKKQAGFMALYNSELDTLFIAFRSTSTVLDYIYDLDIRLYPWPYKCHECKKKYTPISQLFNVRLHNGFLSKYHHIRDVLHEFLDSYKHSKIVFTGHSLGGALAQIAALDIAMTFHTRNSVVTFGSPKVGTRTFATMLEKYVSIYRIAHPKDIVTSLPFHPRYFHAGNNKKVHDIQVLAYNILLFTYSGQHHSGFHRQHIYHDYLKNISV